MTVVTVLFQVDVSRCNDDGTGGDGDQLQPGMYVI
jgi:hypothetical protein